MTTLPLLRELGSPALVRGVGYALLHSLWQGGVLALLLAGALPLLRRQRAELRYAVAASALASLVLVVGLTFGFYYQKTPVAAGPYLASAPTAYLASPLAPIVASAPPAPALHAAPLLWLQAHSGALEAYLPVVVVAWLLGLLLMSGRLAGGLLYVGQLRRAGTQALGAEWQQRLAVLVRRAGVRRPVALLESARVAGPLVLGHLRPVILLPLGAVAGLSPALLEALLAHELAHIVRRDYLLNLGLAVAEVLFFYHPAVWFMANCLRAERENCCDDQAAALCGGDRLRVARALAALAELEVAARPMPRLALAAAGTGGRGSLLARVRRLALARPQAPTLGEGLLAGSLALLGLLGLSTGVVLAARPQLATTPRQVARRLVASPADTSRQQRAGLPPLAPVPSAPPLPPVPQVQASREPLEEAETRPRVRMRVLPGPPRRGPASTVVIEKDKKGRVVNLTVDGERVETSTGKKAKRSKKVRTVEVVQVPGRADSFFRMERVERPERPEHQSFSFNFSSDEIDSQARRAARQGLAEALRSSDLTAEERQEMEREMQKLAREGLKDARLDSKLVFKDFSLDLHGAVASHPAHPRYYIERNKRGMARLKFYKQDKVLHANADMQADREPAQADLDAAQADREAAQADRDAEQADRVDGDATRRRAELRARIAGAQAELRALDRTTGRGPVVPRAPQAPQAPVLPQAPPAPPAPPAPNTGKLRAALRQDGLIGKDDRNFSFELNDKGGRVNGQALTPAQLDRYRQLMGQSVSGKGQTSSFRINVNEN
jgi:bla regulator protein BlaR1